MIATISDATHDAQPRERPLVTIAIPLLNEARLLPGLLDALRAQTWPREAMQVIFVDGGSTDGTRAIARAALADFPRALLLENPDRLAATGLNRALARARGDFFLRLDARSRPDHDYVERCVAHLETGACAGVAGPQVAVGLSDAGRAIALALNHPLGAGGPSYRRAQTLTESDTLYLGAYPTAQLQAVGGWDAAFDANEDYELNLRLREAGGRLWVAPDIRVAYVARDSLRGLARQYARYGAWRVITRRKHPRAMRLRHLAPAVWSGALALSLLALPLTPWPLAVMLLPYLLAITLTTLRLSAIHGWRRFPWVWLAFPTMHLAWAAGFWRRALFRK
ncbi:MAG TPA: glycosyltransferase family 2 protein [Anaerolineae bacterium]|nr:glycosyltransferase family 2 protein [Caldilineae bacterium]HID35393.1 glycosyltransferase family 2 protein [Anaerolineae bacterium]HIQ12307.1 glycosyltransferase family 2 protein [Caldilineales bacterium]